MKPRFWHGIVFNLVLAALVISGAAFYTIHFKGRSGWKKNNSAGQRTLIIKDAGSGKVYGKWPLEEPGEFAVEFIHSVNQSPVREFYQTENGMIRPLAVRFYSFAAGMQSDLGEGQTLSRDGDALVISGFNVSMRELNYIVGTVSDHILIINGEQISLRELCGKNAHITIYLK
jgi:hypothetical protein